MKHNTITGSKSGGIMSTLRSSM